MKRAVVFAGALLVAVPVSAIGQDTSVSVSGNVTLVSDYRFRGFAQTDYKPAFQGGFDLEHTSGLYAGNWNSNVEQHLFNDASLEMDFYGGYTKAIGRVTYDVGALYYAYPGSDGIDHGEIYVGLSFDPVTVKYSHGITNFFGLGDDTALSSRHSGYIEIGVEVPLREGWGILGHLGRQHVKNGVAFGFSDDSYVDWAAGVTKDVNGWTLGASVVGTNATHYFATGGGEHGGRTRGVFSLSKGF